MQKIKQYFNQMSPEQKKKFILALIIIGGTILVFGMYMTTRGSKSVQEQMQSKETIIDLQPGMLEKSLYLQQQTELEEREKQIQELKKEIEELKTQKTAELPPPLPLQPQQPGEVKDYPPPPVIEEKPEIKEPQIQEILVGDIAVVSSPQTETQDTHEEKKKRQIYLPPSFMEATLLSGVDAPTTLGGKANPVPVLIRIKDLAILPNSIKARLKGCFVIAEAVGNLASERAEMRVVSITCLDRKGKSVLDADVDGVVVDQDGKVGLRGKVVAKLGATIARSALAGFLGGVGEGIKQSSVQQTLTPLGGTQTTVKPEDVLKVGVGTGIANAFGELQKFYMELARQSMPVIEVGAGRTVSVIITKGKELEIKDTCGGEECLF